MVQSMPQLPQQQTMHSREEKVEAIVPDTRGKQNRGFSRREALRTTATAAVVATAVETVSHLVAPMPVLPVLAAGVSGPYNVKEPPYNAYGDGVHDDTAAIQAALDAARTNGGGAVYLPAGVYRINSFKTVTDGGSMRATVGLQIGSKTQMYGDGPGATTIQFGPMPNQCLLLVNYNIFNTNGHSYQDVDLTIADLTLDGNAPAQPSTVDAQEGLVFIGVRGALARNCVFTRVFGTTSGANGPNGTNGEGLHTDAKWSADIVWDHCRVENNGTDSTSSGFSANGSTHLSWIACIAYGTRHANGFTNWQCANLSLAGCHAYSNGSDGFHTEYADGITYTGCLAGGLSSSYTPGVFPSAGTSLGNAGHGFTIYQATQAELSGCESRANSQDGFSVDATTRCTLVNCIARDNQKSGQTVSGVAITNCPPSTKFATGVLIVGGQYTANSYGIAVDNTSLPSVVVAGDPLLGHNTLEQASLPLGAVNLSGLLTAPTVPASGTALTNPYPRSVAVLVAGGSISAIQIDGTTTGITSGLVPLRPQGTITLVYSSAPSWLWSGD